MMGKKENPAPSANGNRVLDNVKAGRADTANNTPQNKLRQPKAKSRLSINAVVTESGVERVFVVRGQTAKALLSLVAASHKGCTSLEAASWAYRFAAYCHDLIHKHGLIIRTDKEKHPGGWHGRHVLLSDARILDGNGGQ
jgi:hypothetical protein